jgi:hypothetical protein
VSTKKANISNLYNKKRKENYIKFAIKNTRSRKKCGKQIQM